MDRVRDVMQLGVCKDWKAEVADLADDVRAFAGQQLEADLEPAHERHQRPGHGQRLVSSGEIQSHQDRVHQGFTVPTSSPTLETPNRFSSRDSSRMIRAPARGSEK